MSPRRAPIMLLIFVLGVAATTAAAQADGQAPAPAAPQGTLAVVDVPAPSLAASTLGMPPAERAVVYLPPSYDAQAEKRYPVVYYLPGFADQIFLYSFVPYYQGFQLQEAMDRLIAEGAIDEMIVVIPNGLTPLGGSFYVNSPVNGNWEDFIARDLVGYIDAAFRTVAAPRARAIAGHSMGGFGAFNLAMCHPDIYGAVYALSPGLAAPGGLETHPSFADDTVRERVRGFLDRANAGDSCESRAALLAQASYWNQIFDTLPLFALAYSAAFAPAAGGAGPDYPYLRDGTQFVKNPAAWAKCELGFGGWDQKIPQNLDNLRQLALITIDVGENDEHAWIPAGCRHVSALLTKAGVANQLVVHPGGHEDRLRERMETALFPALSKWFAGQR
jgi:S-formylglutathione hydrolase